MVLPCDVVTSLDSFSMELDRVNDSNSEERTDRTKPIIATKYLNL